MAGTRTAGGRRPGVRGAPRSVDGTARALDERFGTTGFARKAVKKAFPDQWSFLVGEIAMYSFVIILLTGVYLTLFFKPSMHEVVYNGSYTKLKGVEMSEAYASSLKISFDVRGGLLVRQIHHWSTLIFMGAILVHLLRNFFSGAFRKPRELNWLIGILMFMLVMLNGLFGYSLPDDLLSGTGLRILEGVTASIPLVGSYLVMFLFGGEYPGTDIIPRLYVIHVLLIPGLLAALIPLHAIVLTWRQTHTQFPGKGSSNTTVRGYPFFPVFIAKTTSLFLWVLGVTTLLAAFVQINPIWLFGPYDPGAISSGSQPDWYMGWLEGALRIMPAWEINAWGHTVAMSVVIPALVVPGLLFTGLAVYPFLERWVTGDHQIHHLLDRPRDVPARTGIGVGGVVFYGTLWLAGGNDVLADRFHIPLFWTTWFFRFLIILGPVLAYIVAYRICVGLQRRDLALAAHGLETGIIRQSPDGRFSEVERHLPDEAIAAITDPRPAPAVDLDVPPPVDDIESPRGRTAAGRLRAALNRRFRADLAVVPERPPAGENGEREDAVAAGAGREISARREGG
ncbi:MULTISPECIES: cytochrome b [Actinomadura]|uniref:cytochrome bc1 complex cytochrome b subunit n=1 Tax=Actinomadura TaxID=1988 RepID=UPI0003AD395F|nr:ubiquinol-cytochrome c reductase cytochrome b subunit [Actinomadura madurae]MCP9948457.1 ubiquinol-cytochrome c reductase cytochrome b subunit [Actinomadura madurae]MCP9965236.1 ubiquinol-cytochrome c reductase cytochrome b subunit [Actinomadura madurae]MCP9977726.1 ubiquinol-cytochrome c reductase cytochrome b subunit [Actinomadura madurae]MCQ0010784.1 ubiquinol-cytochrome c reductase cytochrome b subunit [Actinomadura madurae]MCQ0013911.1 ubiquinol-cytochrome c reductase cytochrome b subu